MIKKGLKSKLRSQQISQFNKFKTQQIQSKYRHSRHGVKRAYTKQDKDVYNNLEKFIHRAYHKCILNLTKH